MAKMTILLQREPATGKQNIIVKLDSDPDALPVEHEQLHRRLIEKLVGRGIDPEDLGEIVIVREPRAEPANTESAPTSPERSKTAQGQ